jgi:O-antigen/teichoic acid export membrane protein
MQALRIISSFIIAMLVARQLGAAGKGELAFLQQLPSLMALVMGFGFAGVNVYYVGSGKKTAAEAFSDSLLVTLVALVIGVPISFLLLRPTPAATDFADWTLITASLVVPVSVLTTQIAGILTGQGRPSVQAIAQSLGIMLNIAFVAYLYLEVRLSVEAVIAATVISSAASAAVMLVALRTRIVFHGAVARIRGAARYARRRYFMEIAALLEMRVDILMLGLLSTPTSMGVYSVAVALVEMLWFVPRAAETPLLARFLRERDETGVELVATTVRLTVLLECVLVVGAAAFLAPAVKLLFGPNFVHAPVIFWILAPGVIMNGLVGPIVSYLTSRGHQFPGLAAASVAGNVALNLLLVPALGVAGAALASSITYTAGSVWYVWRFGRETGCDPSRLFVPRRDDIKALFTARGSDVGSAS